MITDVDSELAVLSAVDYMRILKLYPRLHRREIGPKRLRFELWHPKMWCEVVEISHFFLRPKAEIRRSPLGLCHKRQHEDLVTAIEKGRMDLNELAFKASKQVHDTRFRGFHHLMST